MEFKLPETAWYVMLLVVALAAWLLYMGTRCLTLTLDEEPYLSVTLHSLFCNGHLGDQR